MTSSAVTEYQPPTVAGSLIEWAQAGHAASELAARLVQTPFIPSHFAGKPGEATAAIIFGAEVGLSPLQALQSIYVIGGKPAMYAKTLMAVALSQGHEVWTEELTDSRAIVCGRRRGTQNVERVVWTFDRARKAGYTKNAKYGTDPQSMLLARAQSDVCRRIAADALLGMPYSVEELEDSQSNGDAPKTETEPKRRTAQRAPVAVPEPPLEPTHQELEWQISPEQRGKLMACYAEAGLTDRDKALAWTSWLLKREVISRKTLSVAEASLVIDALTARIEERAEVAEPTLDEADLP